MRIAGLFVLMACLLGADDAPYAGKWKMNVAKSDFGETTVTYEALAGGAMKATMDGQSYTFRFDSKENQTPWGMTVAWKEVDPSTWEATDRIKFKVTATSTWKLAPGGKELKLDMKRVKGDGTMSNASVNYQRVSGGPGLAGKWKTRNLQISSPEMLVLTPKGNDGLTILLGNDAGTCDARFDGKPHPATGPVWPAGWTCTIARSGARRLDLLWKKDGRDMYRSSLAVSVDGRTLTETGSAAAAASERIVVVYDKQ